MSVSVRRGGRNGLSRARHRPRPRRCGRCRSLCLRRAGRARRRTAVGGARERRVSGRASSSRSRRCIASVLSDNTHTSWPMPEMLGWVVERQHRRGFHIAGFKSGFARLSARPVANRADLHGLPERHLPNSRMNDAGVDRSGRHLGGHDGRSRANSHQVACTASVSAGDSTPRHDSGYVVSNGPTFRARRAVSHGHDATSDLSAASRRTAASRQARGVRQCLPR